VSNVNDTCPRRNAENHAFHCAHEVIGVSKSVVRVMSKERFRRTTLG
jgi:hypothetical protein